MMGYLERLGVAALLCGLGACAGPQITAPCPVCEPCVKCVEPAATAPIVGAPVAVFLAAAWAELPGWMDDDQSQAWQPFLRSCKALRLRKEWKDWQAVCEAAGSGPAPDRAAARTFFEQHFRPWSLRPADGTADGLVTGYYEPVLKGSRMRTEKAVHPILAVPDDLLVIDLSALYPALRGLRLRGKLEGRRVVPYDSRGELRKREKAAQTPDGGAAAIAWVEDPIESFFLQIQGSGRIALPDGGVLRVGYADQNGHPYQSIGRFLIDRGDLKPEQASMQGIQAWARANPDRLDEVLAANPSYVFFRELPPSPDGPPGALGQALQAERSIAVDPRYTPLGSPVFLATTFPGSGRALNRLVLAQDTGGAIKGVVRADYFWGTGPDAGQAAGRMKQTGRMWVLLPVGMIPAQQ